MVNHLSLDVVSHHETDTFGRWNLVSTGETVNSLNCWSFCPAMLYTTRSSGTSRSSRKTRGPASSRKTRGHAKTKPGRAMIRLAHTQIATVQGLQIKEWSLQSCRLLQKIVTVHVLSFPGSSSKPSKIFKYISTACRSPDGVGTTAP